MSTPYELYIDGRWLAPCGTGTIAVIDSATEAEMGRVPEGIEADAQAAVAAARAAFDAWAATPAKERGEYLVRVAAALEARSETLVQLMTGETGTPVTLARTAVQTALRHWQAYARLAGDFAWHARVGHSLVVREAAGVVAAITPSTEPFHSITLTVAAALAAGCTVVLKPSGVAPLNAFVLAEAIHAAKLPAGVFNLVTGNGPTVGEVLASHPSVDMVSLTGATSTGRRVAALAAATVKRVVLALGGKPAAVILEDADVRTAVEATVNACFLNAGQNCAAPTRMIVPEARYEEVRALARMAAEAFVPGDPRNEATRLGPLASAAQATRVRGGIRRGIEEGAELVTGGPDRPAGLAKGFFVRPTVFGRVHPKATLAQEEIVGPVLAILTYRDEDEAVRITNDSLYGLAGTVWAASDERAMRVARRLRTGPIGINGATHGDAAALFGGVKQSGYGRQNGGYGNYGGYGLETFLEPKSLQLKAGREPSD